MKTYTNTKEQWREFSQTINPLIEENRKLTYKTREQERELELMERSLNGHIKTLDEYRIRLAEQEIELKRKDLRLRKYRRWRSNIIKFINEHKETNRC